MYQSEIDLYHRLTGKSTEPCEQPTCKYCGGSLVRTVGKFKNADTGVVVYDHQAFFCDTCEYMTDPEPIKRTAHG